MGFFQYLINNLDRDLTYYISIRFMNYHNITIKNTFNILYYTIKYGWNHKRILFNNFIKPKLMITE